MSRRMLDRELTRGSRQGSEERYTPGSSTPSTERYEYELLDAIATPYLECPSLKGTGLRWCIWEVLDSLPSEPEEMFDHNRVLDTLISRIAVQGDEEHLMMLGEFLDNLVQHFYGWGLNAFSIDLQGLPVMPVSIASNLKGKEGHPLEFTCRCELLSNFGLNNEYCNLTYFGDLVYGGGHHIEHSEFILHGTVREGRIGMFSDSSVFRLGDVGLITSEQRRNNTFYITEEVSHSSLREFLNEKGGRFYSEGNTLLIPDGKGDWKKIVPDDTPRWKEVKP